MLDLSVTVDKQGTRYESTLGDLIGNEPTLVCSIVRPFELTTLAYIEYLLTLNVRVIVITTKSIGPVTIYTNIDASNLTCVVDTNYKLIEKIAKSQNKSCHLQQLGRSWLFQALFVNRELVEFVEQPTKDRKTQIKKSITEEQMRNLFGQNKTSVLKKMLNLPEYLLFDQHAVGDFANGNWDPEIVRIIYYHNIWPTKLQGIK